MAPMTDARRIARVLMDVAFACPAAILVAFVDDPRLVVLWQGKAHLRTLVRQGCLLAGGAIPFSQQVATILLAVHGVQAWSLRESS
jgi:hypothetical protein